MGAVAAVVQTAAAINRRQSLLISLYIFIICFLFIFFCFEAKRLLEIQPANANPSKEMRREAQIKAASLFKHNLISLKKNNATK